ncbi:hypothetical protein HDU85_006089 [Gaertneriomyces sp. JEL0708]|nr:hypothetical protein HDU85_006089 [Gaertneriomyces sp. JEL0708]
MASLYSSMLSDENVPSSPIAADETTPAGSLEQEEVATVIHAAELGLAISTSLSPTKASQSSSGEKSPRKRRRREVDFTYSPRARGSKTPRHENTNDVSNNDVSPSGAIFAGAEAVKGSTQDMEVAETSHQTADIAADAHAEIWSDPEEAVSVMTPTHKRVKVKPTTRSPLVKFFRQLVGVVEEEEESHTDEQSKPITMEILTQAMYEEEVVEIVEQEIPDIQKPTSTIAGEEEVEGAASVAAQPSANRDTQSPVRSDTDDLLTQKSYTPRQSPIRATYPEVFSPQLLDSGNRDPSASPQLIDDREVPSQPGLERSQPSTPLRNKRTHKKRQPVLDLPKMDRVLVVDGPAIKKKYANWSHGAVLPHQKARNGDEADGGRNTSVAPESVLGDDSVLELDSLVTQDGNSMTDANAEVRPKGLTQVPNTRNQASSDVRRLPQPHAKQPHMKQPEISRASRRLTPQVRHNAGESIITLNDLLPSVGVPEDFEDFVISLDGTTPYSIAFNPAWKGKEREPDAAVIL